MLKEQVGLLTLLQEFDSLCRKHQITYYLEGGSLLGAVRHQGFLPWDDDIDLCITRDNWKKLLAVLDEELPENREFFCYERYPQYLRETVKYTNLDSTVLFPNHILDGLAAGQHIDLFILDPAPSDPEEQARYKALACVYSELMTPVYVLSNDILDHLETYHHYRRMMRKKGREYTLNRLREQLYAYEDSADCTTYYLRWGNRHRFFDKAYFGTPVEVTFEGGRYPAPQQYYRFLRAEFGDTWMQIPETAQQEDHSTYDNYRIPCRTFMADYRPFIDYTAMERQYARRKQLNLRKLQTSRRMRRHAANLLRELQETNLQPLTHALTPQAEQWLAEGRFADLVRLFEPYYRAQSTPDLQEFGIALRVDDTVLSAAALALIMVGRYGEAERLIAVQEPERQQAQPIAKLSRLIADIRGCMLACEEQRYADAAALAAPWLASYPLQYDLAVFRLEQALREGEPAADLLTRAESLLARYPHSDRLMKLAGDLCAATGKTAEAEAWYRRCAAYTRNGLLRMDLAAYIVSDPAPEPDPVLPQL